MSHLFSCVSVNDDKLFVLDRVNGKIDQKITQRIIQNLGATLLIVVVITSNGVGKNLVIISCALRSI